MMLGQRETHALTAMALLVALATGCAAEDEATLAGPYDSGAASMQPDAAFCAPEACSCGTLPGVRRCGSAGQLAGCECDAPSPVPPDAAVRSVGICPAGRYAGNFEGTAGFIIPTADISGFELFDDKPPLQITLSPAVGDEFEVLGDGVMRGNANGTFPFEAMIKGKLDCNTKKFTATLTGSVQILLEGIRNDFMGTMESSYDTDARAFSAGKWTVTGSEADGGSDFGLTGNGSWSAAQERDGGSDAGR
jgi:hypothetical protein